MSGVSRSPTSSKITSTTPKERSPPPAKAILDNHKEFMEMMHAAPADDVYDEEPA